MSLLRENRRPLVSVVVPSYNHERYVAQCIESILGQTFQDFELIVFDDGSTDKSRSILRDLQKKHGFTLVEQENMGLPGTFNKALREYVTGTFFTFCASDDYWVPEKLEKQVAFMERNPHIPMCFGKVYAVDEDSKVIGDLTEVKNRHLRGGEIFADILLMNFHPPVNYLIRTSVFEEVGYYREDIFTEDFYMNLRISSRYQIGYIDDYLFYYRVIRDLTRRPYTLKSSLAHLACISEYQGSEHYREAMRRWYFRNFIFYSPYREHKVYALKGMLRSLAYFYKPAYLKSLVRLALVW